MINSDSFLLHFQIWSTVYYTLLISQRYNYGMAVH